MIAARVQAFICSLLMLLPAAGNTGAGLLQVSDDLQGRLVFDKPVNRIIALSPHLAELVYEAGAQDKLLATVDFADYPQAAKQILRVGSYNTWDVEKILALQPDVVVGWLSAMGIEAVQQLRALGLKVYVSEPRALSDISRTIRDIGSMAGTDAQAGLKADQFDAAVEGLKKKYQHQKKIRLFYQV